MKRGNKKYNNYNNYKGDNMKEKIKKIIYNWVDANFGPHEAQDPSWDIDSLSAEIAKHITTIKKENKDE